MMTYWTKYGHLPDHQINQWPMTDTCDFFLDHGMTRQELIGKYVWERSKALLLSRHPGAPLYWAFVDVCRITSSCGAGRGPILSSPVTDRYSSFFCRLQSITFTWQDVFWLYSWSKQCICHQSYNIWFDQKWQCRFYIFLFFSWVIILCQKWL